MTVYIATPLQNQAPWYPGRTYVLGAYFELTGTALASGDTIVFRRRYNSIRNYSS